MSDQSTWHDLTISVNKKVYGTKKDVDTAVGIIQKELRTRLHDKSITAELVTDDFVDPEQQVFEFVGLAKQKDCTCAVHHVNCSDPTCGCTLHLRNQ